MNEQEINTVFEKLFFEYLGCMSAYLLFIDRVDSGYSLRAIAGTRQKISYIDATISATDESIMIADRILRPMARHLAEAINTPA